MKNKTTSLHSNFSVDEEIIDNDTRFLKITIDVMHDNENLNGSFFTKDVVNACVDSIQNTPVLGFVKYDKEKEEDDFKGHEYILARTKDGVEERYVGSAYGVIPESCNPRWIVKMCDDGVERNFLQVDALMWEKFSDSTGILRRDGEKSQSMEIDISSVEWHEEDGIVYFDSFKFDGCCILGDDVVPAMTGANVVVNEEVQFAMSDFVKNIQSELNDKWQKYSSFTKLVDKETNENQGGVRNMPKPETNYSQTVMEQFADISNAVEKYATTRNRWGEERPRYHAVDVQDDEVIVVDCENGYFNYGFPFTINGDKPEINFAGGCRKKVRYENYEDGATELVGAFDLGKHIAEIEDAAFAKVGEADSKLADVEKAKDEIEVQFSQIKSELDEIKPKFEEYTASEEARKVEELNAEKDAKFAEYEDILKENADFTALKEKKDELSVDDIEKECAVMFVKSNRQNKNFSANSVSGAIAIGLISEGDDGTSEGYVQTKYGLVKKSR